MANVLTKIAAVMAAVKTLTMDSQGYGYKYASTDQIFTMLRSLCAEHELVVEGGLVNHTIAEVTMGKGQKVRKTQWMTAVFQFRFAGEEHWEQRVQGGEVNCPQDFGAISTYARRYWLRDKLMLSTGDEGRDLDARDRNEYQRQNGRHANPKPKKEAPSLPKPKPMPITGVCDENGDLSALALQMNRIEAASIPTLNKALQSENALVEFDLKGEPVSYRDWAIDLIAKGEFLLKYQEAFINKVLN